MCVQREGRDEVCGKEGREKKYRLAVKCATCGSASVYSTYPLSLSCRRAKEEKERARESVVVCGGIFNWPDAHGDDIAAKQNKTAQSKEKQWRCRHAVWREYQWPQCRQ